MQVNKKKTITLKNRTNYFIPDKDRVKVRFSSPDSYQSRQIKIEGYETRLYWQFRYCEDHSGQTYFYTLTYNDAHIPNHYGINCFDYEDLRDLFTGGFRKQLLRKYGTTFKYFVGAELGDGKGQRGMHNNPHYHVLFFLEDARNEKFPYKRIDPKDFRHLVRLYWQGFDEDVDGYRDYNEAKYGIAKEGENLGKVTDFRACMYCAKYVCKDVKLKQNEDKVLSRLRFELTKKYKNSEEVYSQFFKTKIFEMYNTPLNAKHTKWSFTEEELINILLPDTFDIQYDLFGACPNKYIEYYGDYVSAICSKYHLWKEFYDFLREFVEPKIKEGLNEWRNRYCNKCRISQGVGDYALEHIEDKLNPTIKIPSKKGFKKRPIGMYLYRKLYTDVYKDARGNNVRVLNDLGMQYKLAKLNTRLSKMSKEASSNIQILINDKALFEKMRDSDVNTDVFFTYEEFLKRFYLLLKDDNLENICNRYAEYKLVYEDRFFSYDIDRNLDVVVFPNIDVTGDYKRFLVPSFFSVSRNDLMLDMFLENTPENYLPYSEHPYFLRYISIFRVFDLCSDYWFIQKDNKSQKEAEERAALRRFHSQSSLKLFYSQFKNI